MDEIEVKRVHLPLFYYSVASVINKTGSESIHAQPYLKLMSILLKNLSGNVFKDSFTLSNFRYNKQTEDAVRANSLTNIFTPLAEYELNLETIKDIYEITEHPRPQKWDLIQLGRPTMQSVFQMLCALIKSIWISELTLSTLETLTLDCWKLYCPLLEYHMKQDSTLSNWSAPYLDDLIPICLNVLPITELDCGLFSVF